MVTSQMIKLNYCSCHLWFLFLLVVTFMGEETDCFLVVLVIGEFCFFCSKKVKKISKKGENAKIFDVPHEKQR